MKKEEKPAVILRQIRIAKTLKEKKYFVDLLMKYSTYSPVKTVH